MSSLFALAVLSYPEPEYSVLSILRSAFILASVLALWNWIYDIIAIKKGVLEVYNRQYAEKRGAEAVTTQYAPAFFGAFGLAYGAALRIWEMYLTPGQSEAVIAAVLILPFLLMIALPPVCSVLISRAYVGESGLHSYCPETEEENPKTGTAGAEKISSEAAPDSHEGDAVI